jgi:hypothetical protein
MMASLRCDHPGIEEFVVAKRPSGALRHFNLRSARSRCPIFFLQANQTSLHDRVEVGDSYVGTYRANRRRNGVTKFGRRAR